MAAPVGIAIHPMATLLGEFAERHPRVQVDLSVSDRPVDLLAEGFDVVMRLLAHPQDRTLISRRLGTERVVICGAPRYFARRAPPQVPHELVHHNCLRMTGREWVFQMDGEPVTVLDPYVPDTLTISLVYPQRKNMPLRVRVFIDFVTERFRKAFRGG
ncbi:MAG TPA: substrate binding domain-containing protein [Myxococcaceae bacterium]|nr:substrate binding domain-containing protein [Myxococcaceae bacterium]